MHFNVEKLSFVTIILFCALLRSLIYTIRLIIVKTYKLIVVIHYPIFYGIEKVCKHYVHAAGSL